MAIRTYTNWNSRPHDKEEQIEPFRKYYFICEGANTETFYFEKLIDLRKELGIHPLIDIRLLEKTDKDQDITFPKQLAAFAEKQKEVLGADFEKGHDRIVVVFDADIFEEKVQGYDELITEIEDNGNIPGVTNPGFELFLLLHIKDSYDNYIEGHEAEFLSHGESSSLKHAYDVLHKLTGMNAKRNPGIGELAEDVLIAIGQEKKINQDVHNVKGIVSSNLAAIIETIMKETPPNL